MSARNQSGNVFFALFGAVGLVGVLGAATTTIMKGPVAGMQKVTKYTVAENQMIASGRLSLVAAATQSNSGDCDNDGFIEPVPWTAPGTTPAPSGGGIIPTTIGASRQDPWGSTYGYCVWDHGPQIANAGCGGASQNRLRGINAEDKIVIALISAGPDKTFQTTCANNPAYVTKPATSDDVVMTYTYAEAASLGAGLWNIKSGAPNTAEIAKNLEVKNSGGDVVFGVDSTSDAARPAIKVDYIQKLSAARKGVEFLSNIIIGSTWLSGDGDNEGIWIDGSGNVGVGTNAPGYKLDVNGTTRINNNVDISQPAASTSARSLRVGYEDNNNYARLYSYGSAHASLPGRFLIDNVVSGSNGTGGYLDFQPGANYTRLYASGGATGTLQFYTGGTVSMAILADGSTGIGIAAPTQRLHVAGGNALVAGEIISTGASSNQFRAIGGNFGAFVRNDGNNVYWLLTNSGNQYGTYNSLRPFAFNVTTGNVTMAHDVNVGGVLTADGGVVVDGVTVISGTNGYIHTARSTVANRYGYFEMRNDTGSRGAYFGYGNGTSTVNLTLDAATSLVFSGGTLDMSSNRILNVTNPVNPQDAATKNYVDSEITDRALTPGTGDSRYVNVTGDTMTGTLTMGGTASINMGNSKITSLATPTAAADAATKAYVDSTAAGAADNLGSGGSTTGTLYSKNASGYGYVGTDGNNLWRFDDSSLATPRALLRIDGTWMIDARPTQFGPYANNLVNLGSSTVKFKNGYFAADVFADGNFAANAADAATAPGYSWNGDTDTGMWRAGTNAIGFATAGVNRVTIGSGGVVTLTSNLTTPANITAGGQFLGDVGDSAALPSFSFSADPNIGMWRAGTDALGFSTAGVNRMTIGSTGNITTTARITAGERVYADGFYYSSDRNLKKNIETVTDPFKILNGFTGRKYVWKESGKAAYGLIAQEVETTMPEAVGKNDVKGMKAVDYNQVISPLVEAAKKLKVYYDDLAGKVTELFDAVASLRERDDALAKDIEALKAENEMLKKRLDALEQASRPAS